ncbi:shikimate dehydrogenase [Thermodesulfobacteriota bacterium]
MQYPTVHTKLAVLLGNPLEHTLSPVMHNHVFKKLDMDCIYFPVEVTAENLKTVFSGLTRMNMLGFNVTMPHKMNIISLLDDIDPLTAAIGAVNTICLERGRTKGYNTDGEGFVTAIEQDLKQSVAQKKVFILGCGGAARSIAMTLASKGCEKIFLCNRTISKAEALSADINKVFEDCSSVVPRELPPMGEVLPACDLLINTTSIGMHPYADNMPLDESLLFKGLAVADIVYNPLETLLLKAANKIGCSVVNGLGMLVYQGAKAFKLWTGVDPPVHEMFEVLQSVIASPHG